MTADIRTRVNELNRGGGAGRQGDAVIPQPPTLGQGTWPDGSAKLLKPHQLVGLNWLKVIADAGYSCVLGDEMGLGKTVQAMALMASLFEGT